MHDRRQRVQIHSLACGCPAVPALACRRDCLSLLNGPDTFAQNQLTINVWVYFWTFYSSSLMHLCIPLPGSHCPDCRNYAVSVEIRQCESSSPVLLSPGRLGYSGSLVLLYEFYITLSFSVKNSQTVPLLHLFCCCFSGL